MRHALLVNVGGLDGEAAREALARRVASLRFHRACILDELGLTEQSELDYAWLDSFGFHETDKLN